MSSLAEKLLQRQNETAGGSGKYFKCKPGKNLVRLFKFAHTVTKADVDQGYFEKDQKGEDVDELDRPITLHYNYKGSKKPVVSNAKVMADYHALAKGDKEDQAAGELIKPQTKYFVNVVDVDDQKTGMRVWGIAKGVYNAILKVLNDPEYGGEDAMLGRKGNDFVVNYDDKAKGKEMYSVVPRAAGKSEKLSSEIEEGLQDLYDPEVLATIGTVLIEPVDDEEDSEEEESEEKAETEDEDEELLPKKKKAASDDDEDEEESEEDDEEEEERKKSVKRDVDEIFADRKKKKKK